MQFKRVQKRQAGLCETFKEPFKIRLYHNEVERAFELISEENLLQLCNFWCEIFTDVLSEHLDVLVEHRCQILFFLLKPIINMLACLCFKRIPQKSLNFLNHLFLRQTFLFIQLYAHKNLILKLRINLLPKLIHIIRLTQVREP